MRRADQRTASLEQNARQPRLAMEADVTIDAKTRKRTEGAAAAERVISGDNSSAQVDTYPIHLTSFGDDSTEAPALPCSRDDAQVDEGAAAPKPCLSPVGMGTRSATGSFLPVGIVSTAMMAIFHQLPLRFCLTGEIKSKTSNQYATDYSSFWKLKVIQTKSSQTLLFDPCGSTGRLRACPFLGTWRALLRGELFDRAPNGTHPWLEHFLTEE